MAFEVKSMMTKNQKKFGNNYVLCSSFIFSKELNTKFLFATRKDIVQHDLNLLRIIHMFEISFCAIRSLDLDYTQFFANWKTYQLQYLAYQLLRLWQKTMWYCKMTSIMLICLYYAPQLSKIFVNWHHIYFPVCSSNLASVYAWKYHLHPINLAEIATTISQMPNLHHFSIDRLGIWESAHHRQCKTGSCNLRIRELTF